MTTRPLQCDVVVLGNNKAGKSTVANKIVCHDVFHVSSSLDSHTMCVKSTAVKKTDSEKNTE